MSSGLVGLRSLTRGFPSRLNTMSALINDEFFITLPSNATQGSPAGNRPSRYETRLAHPLRLDGVWEAALINFTYPHEWSCLERDTVSQSRSQHLEKNLLGSQGAISTRSSHCITNGGPSFFRKKTSTFQTIGKLAGSSTSVNERHTGSTLIKCYAPVIVQVRTKCAPNSKT